MPPKAGGPLKDRGGLVTSQQCECFRQCLRKEESIVKPRLQEALARVGDLNRPNNYLGFYKKDGVESGETGLKFTIDQIQDETPYDQRTSRDTCRPQHPRNNAGLQTSRPVRSSQAYGWYQPIDQPKFGFERTRICQDSFMDHSHLHLKPPSI